MDFLSSVTGVAIVAGAVLYSIYSGLLFKLPSQVAIIILVVAVLIVWAFLVDKRLVSGSALK